MTNYQLDITAARLANQPEHQARELEYLACELTPKEMRYLLEAIAMEEHNTGQTGAK